MLIDPKPLELTTQAGETKTFLISKVPAVQMREIVAKYPVANMPKVGDYGVSQETMLKLMAYCAVETAEGHVIPLQTVALVNNHAGDWETLARLEWAMMEYNVSFFGKGLNSGSLPNMIEKARPLISQILTALSAQSSRTEKQPSTS